MKSGNKGAAASLRPLRYFTGTRAKDLFYAFAESTMTSMSLHAMMSHYLHNDAQIVLNIRPFLLREPLGKA